MSLNGHSASPFLSFQEGILLMSNSWLPNSASVAVRTVVILCCWCSLPSLVLGYTSEDPVVKTMVKKGVGYLEANANAKTFYKLDSAHSGGFGELCLIGYAHMKTVHDPNHPVVQQGVQAAQSLIRALAEPDPGTHASKTVYASAAATLLLAEVDRVKYRRDLERLAQYFRRAQYPNGAYGYYGEKDGDISQAQYAMLALWTIDRSGGVIDYQGIVKTAAWLLRVQDPSGGWPYQAVDPGGGKRISQQRVTASMGVAGGSALLIAADVLRLWGEGFAANDPQIPGLPKAVKLYLEGIEGRAIRRPTIPADPILSSIGECQAWLGKNSPDPGKLKSDWPYYQLYTLERYESFREVALELDKDPSPAWYNGGVNFLRTTQEADGGWPQGGYTTKSVTTAFAILFLSRSTQKAIGQASSGTLAGGYGLPKDTTDIRVDGTQIKGRPIAAQVTEMLDILEQDGAGETEGKSIPDDLELADDPATRAAQLDRLERLVRGSKSWQARRVAARLLGKSDELRVVPAMIFALSDPDKSVRRYARDGLRFISRKFDGFGMPDDPTLSDLQKAQQQWRDWYRTMNPKYVFLDYDL